MICPTITITFQWRTFLISNKLNVLTESSRFTKYIRSFICNIQVFIVSFSLTIIRSTKLTKTFVASLSSYTQLFISLFALLNRTIMGSSIRSSLTIIVFFSMISSTYAICIMNILRLNKFRRLTVSIGIKTSSIMININGWKSSRIITPSSISPCKHRLSIVIITATTILTKFIITTTLSRFS